MTIYCGHEATQRVCGEVQGRVSRSARPRRAHQAQPGDHQARPSGRARRPARGGAPASRGQRSRRARHRLANRSEVERFMILLDTHVFVWWVARRAKVSARARRAIEKDSKRLLSDISLWEVAKLVSLGRLELDRDPEQWLDEAVEEADIEAVGIDSAIAVRSTRIAANFH